MLLLTGFSALMAQDAADIVRKANDKFSGESSSYGTMSMTIVRPGWERTVTFRNWTKGKDFALTLITGPARDKGQTFLKRGNEMWNWNPIVNSSSFLSIHLTWEPHTTAASSLAFMVII